MTLKTLKARNTQKTKTKVALRSHVSTTRRRRIRSIKKQRIEELMLVVRAVKGPVTRVVAEEGGVSERVAEVESDSLEQ